MVDGVEYRWRVRHKPTYSRATVHSNLTVAIESVETPSCTLVVDLSRSHPSNWMGDPTTPVIPSEVAELIRSARSEGWDPNSSKAAFKMAIPKQEDG